MGGRFLAYPQEGLRSKSGGMLFALALREGRGGNVLSEIEQIIRDYKGSIEEDEDDKTVSSEGVGEIVTSKRPKFYTATWDGNTLAFTSLYLDVGKPAFLKEVKPITRFSEYALDSSKRDYRKLTRKELKRRVEENGGNVIAFWNGPRDFSRPVSSLRWLFKIDESVLNQWTYAPDRI